MSGKTLSKMFGFLLQFVTLFLLSLPMCVPFLFMQMAIWYKRIKLHLIPHKEGHLSHFHGGKMVEVDGISTEEQQDFKKYRSPTYTTQLTFGSLWEFSKLAGSKQKVPLIEDHVMRRVILNSVFCHGLVKADKDSDVEWRLPFDLQNYHMFKGFYWDVSEVRLHSDQKMSIIDRDGGVHTPSSPTWSLAKAHAQAQLTFFAPGLAHNHVHFVFPSLMASQVRAVLPPTSVLRQLLEPHTRFTQYINYQALNVCQSSSNTNSFIDRVFRPWLSFPINNDDFLGGVQERCEHFYYEEFTLRQELQEDLPYHSYLKAYYDVVHEFVQKMEPLLSEDYEVLSSSVSEHLPTLRRHSMCDVITTLIWNCAVVHCSDHFSYLEQFAYKYGCMSIRTPLVESHGTFSLEVSPDEPLQFHNEVPQRSDLFSPGDIYRTRCFLRSFVQYNSHSSLDMTLLSTDYGFSDKSAITSSSQFFQDLKELNTELEERGEAIVSLPNLVRTVCF